MSAAPLGSPPIACRRDGPVGGVTVCRRNVPFLPADLLEARILVEITDRVSAQQRRGLRLRELIPEQFETDCRIPFASLPEDVDHLPENANGAIGFPTADALNQAT